MVPTEILLSRDKKALTVHWADQQSANLPAPFLRENCQSAGSKRARLEHREAAPSTALVINEIHPIGSYAINLVFSDGHDRGIYPWPYLRELSEKYALGN